MAVFGAFMLAVDKGALTLVLTAFQGLPDNQFEAIRPALRAILDRQGWLWVTWAFVRRDAVKLARINHTNSELSVARYYRAGWDYSKAGY